MQAGDKEHVGEGASSALSEGGGASSWSNESLSSYLVCVVEGDAVSPQGAVDIGVVAIEISTGDVLYAQFRCATSCMVSSRTRLVPPQVLYCLLSDGSSLQLAACSVLTDLSEPNAFSKKGPGLTRLKYSDTAIVVYCNISLAFWAPRPTQLATWPIHLG